MQKHKLLISILVGLFFIVLISIKIDNLTTENETLTTENETLSLQVDIALASHLECRDIVDKFIYVIEPQPIVINAEKLKQLNEE